MTTAARTYLTGFGDEISNDLEVQLKTMQQLGLEGLDLRTAFGKNVLQLTDDEVRRVGERVKAHGLRVQSVSSPVNKVRFTAGARGEELKKLERAAEIANLLGIERIRIFTPETEPPDNADAWPQVRAWMADQVDLAKSKNVVLLHENDGRFYGAYPGQCRRLLEEFSGPNFRAVYDFGNSVLLGFRTMRDWFPWVLPHLDTFHIKDAIHRENRFVASGEGEGEMVETFQYVFEQGWHGPLTLEPHAQIAGPQGGFSGEQAFEHAVSALRSVLKDAGLPQ